MSHLFSVDFIFFTLFGYSLSYLEFFGTIFYLLSVYLIAKRKVMTWPIGIVSVLLFMLLFYQIRLYADAAEQVYYLIASIYGWWHWKRSTSEQENGIEVEFSPIKMILIYLGAIFLLSLILGLALSHAHEYSSTLFPEPASYPFVDAFTVMMSLFAMWLLACKRTESWIFWIIVDVISIGLYYVKGVVFISLLYVILLVLAGDGLLTWMRASRPASAEIGTGDIAADAKLME